MSTKQIMNTNTDRGRSQVGSNGTSIFSPKCVTCRVRLLCTVYCVAWTGGGLFFRRWRHIVLSEPLARVVFRPRLHQPSRYSRRITKPILTYPICQCAITKNSTGEIHLPIFGQNVFIRKCTLIRFGQLFFHSVDGKVVFPAR